MVANEFICTAKDCYVHICLPYTFYTLSFITENMQKKKFYMVNFWGFIYEQPLFLISLPLQYFMSSYIRDKRCL